jgi:predicted dehydrogenase
MSLPLRVAVVGAGSLGKEHARIYADLSAAGVVDFVGVYDKEMGVATQIADRHRVQAFQSLKQVIASSEAFSVVTPTSTHYDIASELLAHGKHVLLEKPMTDNASQAAELVRLAREHSCVLQVGHVERFNPVFKYLEAVAMEPRFIETHRLSPFPARSTDIGVVLDLMIHDLDVVLAFVKSPVASFDAVGIPVLSTTEDIANVRIRFVNGCVANLTASRVSPERMRKIRVFSAAPITSYISLDYRAQEGFIYRLAKDGEEQSSLLDKILRARDVAVISQFGGRRIVREPVPLVKEEPLRVELQSFLECIRMAQAPVVSGESAKRALDLALDITRQIQTQVFEAAT